MLVGFGFGWINAAADYSRLPRAASARGCRVDHAGSGAAHGHPRVFRNPPRVGSADESSLSDRLRSDPERSTADVVPRSLCARRDLGLIGDRLDIYSSGLSRPPRACPSLTAGGPRHVMTVGPSLSCSSPIPSTPFTAFLTLPGSRHVGWRHARRHCAAPAGRRAPRCYRPGRYGSGQLGAVASLVVSSLVGWGLVSSTPSSPGRAWAPWVVAR